VIFKINGMIEPDNTHEAKILTLLIHMKGINLYY